MKKNGFQQTPISSYVFAYLALLGLLALTVALSFVRMTSGEWLNDVVAIGIGVAKAALVLMVFMGFLKAPPLGKMWAIGGAAWFLIMSTIVLDYFTRPWDFRTKSWYSRDASGQVIGSSKDRGGPVTPSMYSGQQYQGGVGR